VADTFVRVWSARDRVDLATVRGYLFAIARNLFLQHRRQVHRRAELDEVPIDRGPGPEQQAGARAEPRAGPAAPQAVPELDRAALLMRANDELSYMEIGAALGISVPSARVRVHRARLALARLVPSAAPLSRAQS